MLTVNYLCLPPLTVPEYVEQDLVVVVVVNFPDNDLLYSHAGLCTRWLAGGKICLMPSSTDLDICVLENLGLQTVLTCVKEASGWVKEKRKTTRIREVCF